MGVKDLWAVLSPICEKKSLWELEGTSIAIDLSAWICDSNSICSPQINMYLRNLFFRTSYLLLLGVKPVFVLEGEAPELKVDVIRKRLQVREGAKTVKESAVSRACSRTRLKGLQRQCVELLSSLGIECLKARGEAEALCAHLNANGVVSGVVTQDSDVFLYGANEVYRNFQLAPHYTCDAYRSEVIQEKLKLSRTKLIGFSILAGSDYNEGVSKLGKATICKFLSSLRDDQVYQKFIEWKNGCYFEKLSKDKFITRVEAESRAAMNEERVRAESKELPRSEWRSKARMSSFILLTSDVMLCGDAKLEWSVREKALKDDGFPHLEVIAEFTAEPETPSFEYKWSKPNLAKFVAIAVKKLAWDEDYAAKKFLPILGRWHLTNGGHPCDFSVVTVVGKGQGKNADKYRVAWNLHDIVTAESKALVAQCYPHLVEVFEESRSKKRKPKTTGAGRGRKKKAVESSTSTQTSVAEFLPKEPTYVGSQVFSEESGFGLTVDSAELHLDDREDRFLGDMDAKLSSNSESAYAQVENVNISIDLTESDDEVCYIESRFTRNLTEKLSPFKNGCRMSELNRSEVSLGEDQLHDLSSVIESIVSCPQRNPALDL